MCRSEMPCRRLLQALTGEKARPQPKTVTAAPNECGRGEEEKEKTLKVDVNLRFSRLQRKSEKKINIRKNEGL